MRKNNIFLPFLISLPTKKIKIKIKIEQYYYFAKKLIMGVSDTVLLVKWGHK